MYKRFTIPPYGYLVHLIVGEESLKKVSKTIVGLPESEENLGYVQKMEARNGVEVIAFYLKDGDKDDIIMHECTHAVHFMMEYYGVPISIVNTEVMAYHQDWLFEKVKGLINKHIN